METNEENKNEKMFCFESEGRSIFGNILNSSYKPNTHNTINFLNDLCSTEKNSKLEESYEYSSNNKINQEKIDLELIEKSKLSIPSSNNSNLMMFNKTNSEPKAFIRESPLVPLALYSKISQAVLKDFLCCICSGVVVSAVVDSCNHLFCKPCILEYQSMLPQKNNYFFNYMTCPTNRTSQININRVQFVDNIIKKHFLICKNSKDFGCKWNGSAKEYLSHIQYCDKERVICTLKDNKENYCRWQGLRENIEIHQQECMFRIVFCKYCKLKMTFNQVSEHNNICKEILVNCNMCNKQFLRKFIHEHSNECSKTFIKESLCPYNLCGCKGIIKSDLSNDDLENHLGLYRIYHLNLQNQYLKNLCSTYDENISKIIEKNSELTSQLNKQEKLINELVKLKDNIDSKNNKLNYNCNQPNQIAIAPQFNYNFIGKKLRKSSSKCIKKFKKMDNLFNEDLKTTVLVPNNTNNDNFNQEIFNCSFSNSNIFFLFPLINIDSKLLSLNKINTQTKCSLIFDQIISIIPKNLTKLIFKVYVQKELLIYPAICATSYFLNMNEKSMSNHELSKNDLKLLLDDSTIKISKQINLKKGNCIFFMMNIHRPKHIEIYKNDNLLHDFDLESNNKSNKILNQNQPNFNHNQSKIKDTIPQILEYFPILINDSDENYHVELLI